MTSAQARKQARKGQTKTAGSRAHSHKPTSDVEARFAALPWDLQHAIGCRNAAAVIRDHAKRDDVTIEAYVTDAIVNLNGDRGSISVLLSVVGLIAAEDERRGGGPLRLAEETFAAHPAVTR